MADENELIRLNVDDIKPGDEIYVAMPIKFGNTPFRYPMYRKETVIKVTPKKTKVKTDKNDWYVNTAKFYTESPELLRRNLVTHHTITALNKIGDLSYHRLNIRNMSDENIIRYAQLICEATAMLCGTKKD